MKEHTQILPLLTLSQRFMMKELGMNSLLVTTTTSPDALRQFVKFCVQHYRRGSAQRGPDRDDEKHMLLESSTTTAERDTVFNDEVYASAVHRPTREPDADEEVC